MKKMKAMSGAVVALIIGLATEAVKLIVSLVGQDKKKGED